MAVEEKDSLYLTGATAGPQHEDTEDFPNQSLGPSNTKCPEKYFSATDSAMDCDSEELSNDLGHTTLIRENYAYLVKQIQPQLFHHLLEPYLRDSIEDQPGKLKQSRALLDVLMRSPRKFFNQFCKVIAGIHPAIFEVLKKRKPTTEESACYLKPFCDKLRQGILLKGSVTDNDIDKRIDLDTQFVPLKLVDISKQENRPTQSQNVPHYLRNEDSTILDYYQYNLEHIQAKDIDIKDILPEEAVGKSILITGRAGVGKSTLIQFLNRQWAKEKWGRSHTAVFLLNLRKLVHFQSQVNLSELFGFHAEYVPASHDSHPPAVQWLEKNMEKVVIFTDGIDEVADFSRLFKYTRELSLDSRATPLEWCINLMRRNVLQDSTLFLISRPFSALQKLKNDLQIDVFGLVPENIMHFVELNVNLRRQSVVKETLLRNPVLLSISSITFYCGALAKIFEEDENVDVSGLTTYTRITAFILTQLAARRGKSEMASLVLSDHLAKCLPHLAALAYRGLSVDSEKLTRLVFEERDFSATRFSHEEIQQARETGLLICRDVKDQVNDTETSQAEFVHLSIQEILAAAHLLKSDVHNVESYLPDATEIGRLNMSQLFLFGLALDTENKHVAEINKGVMTEAHGKVRNDQRKEIKNLLLKHFHLLSDKEVLTQFDTLQIVQTAYESQRPDVARLVGARVAPDSAIRLFSMHLTAVDMKALFFVLQYSSIEQIVFQDVAIDNASAWEIKKHIPQLPNLRSLCLINNGLSEGAMSYISDAVKAAKGLTHLVLVNKQITGKGMKYLAEAVNSNTTLNTLQLWKSTFTAKDMEWFSSTIRKHLRHLQLLTNHLPDEAVRHLANAIKNNPVFEHLVLSISALSVESMQYPSTGIRKSTSLKTVHMQDATILASGMKDLFDAISSSTSLNNLILENLQLTDESMEYLSGAIVATTSLKELTLANNQITDKGINQLSDGIKRTKSLSSLILEDNVLTSQGMRDFSCAIRDSTTLQHLHLSNNQVSNNGMRFLASALGSTRCLTELVYVNNQITTEGMKHLSAALKSPQSVNKVFLGGNHLNDGGMEHLLDAIATTKSLSSLILFDNNVTEERLKSVRWNCGRNTRPMIIETVKALQMSKKGARTQFEMFAARFNHIELTFM